MKFGFEARKSSNYEADKLRLRATSPSRAIDEQRFGGGGRQRSGQHAGGIIPRPSTKRNTQPTNRYSWYYGGIRAGRLPGVAQSDFEHRVRWEMDTPMIDTNNRMNGFDSSQINRCPIRRVWSRSWD